MAKTKKSSKKSVKIQVVDRLETAFADLLMPLGKTKFHRNIKRAAKALTEDFKGFESTAPEKIKKRKAKTTRKEKRQHKAASN